jgi:thioredoxin 1
MAEVRAVSVSSFEAEVLKSEIPVLVDFWAVWCGPCRLVAPIVEELAKEYEGRVKVANVNVDEERALAQKYGIQSIPTLMFFKGGSPAGQIIGVQPKEKIAAKLDELLEG